MQDVGNAVPAHSESHDLDVAELALRDLAQLADLEPQELRDYLRAQIRARILAMPADWRRGG